MNSSQWAQISSLFQDACEQPREGREEWLAAHCADAAVGAEVLAMLRAYDTDPEFLEQPADAGNWLSGAHAGRRLLAASFRRVITPPQWSIEMNDFRRLGGWGIDLHIHDNHYISLLCGVPREVYSRGLLRDGLVNHVSTQYVYDDPELTVSCISGGLAAEGLKFAASCEIFLERATLQYDAGTYGAEWVVNRPLTLITDDGRITTPNPGGGGEWCAAFTEELQAAVDGVKTGAAPPVLSGQLARDALRICYAEAESIKTGRPVPIR